MLVQPWEQVALVHLVEEELERREGSNFKHRQSISLEETSHTLGLKHVAEALEGTLANVRL